MKSAQLIRWHTLYFHACTFKESDYDNAYGVRECQSANNNGPSSYVGVNGLARLAELDDSKSSH